MLKNIRSAVGKPAVRTLCLAAFALGAAALGVCGQLTAKQILQRSSKPYEQVIDYTVNGRLSVSSPSLHVPRMDVKIYFKKPNKLYVEGKDGFAMLPKDGFVAGNPLNAFVTGGKYTLGGPGKAAGLECYIVKNTDSRNGHVVKTSAWIDRKDFLVRQITTSTDWGASTNVKLSYTKIDNRYWMPSSTTAKILVVPNAGSESKSAGMSGSPVIVNMKFSGYRVNTGLSDSIFQKHKGGK